MDFSWLFSKMLNNYKKNYLGFLCNLNILGVIFNTFPTANGKENSMDMYYTTEHNLGTKWTIIAQMTQTRAIPTIYTYQNVK